MANHWIPWLRAQRLSLLERAVLTELLWHANADRVAFPSAERLARYIGSPERSIVRALHDLAGRKLIELLTGNERKEALGEAKASPTTKVNVWRVCWKETNDPDTMSDTVPEPSSGEQSATPLSDGWHFGSEVLEYASKAGIAKRKVMRELRRFEFWHETLRGTRSADWPAEWRQWCDEYPSRVALARRDAAEQRADLREKAGWRRFWEEQRLQEAQQREADAEPV
jgi:hypothetical protein